VSFPPPSFDKSVGIYIMGQLFISDTFSSLFILLYSSPFLGPTSRPSRSAGQAAVSARSYVNCADDASPVLCPWNAGLSSVRGDGLGIQRSILDLRDLRHGDYATGPLARDHGEAVSS
jgi:hypothetical protein